MNTTATTATTTPSAPGTRHSVRSETLAITDKESWHLISRRISLVNFEEPKRTETVTSMSVEEWKKQVRFIYVDAKGRHRTTSIGSLSNSADMSYLFKDSYLSNSSSECRHKSAGEMGTEIDIVGSTSLFQTQKSLMTKKMEYLFRAYEADDFEDGAESEFINELKLCIAKYGTTAVEALATIVHQGDAKPRALFEALRWLGSIGHSESYRSRLFCLERSLRNQSRWVRDGAALGLASMKDAHAVPYLRDAIDREQILDLRKDLQDVLNRLEHLSHAPLSSHKRNIKDSPSINS